MKYKSLKGIHPYYLGIRGVYLISHGTNADPELSYKGHTVNYYDIENECWESYKDYCQDNGLKPNTEDFDNYCIEHATSIKEYIISLSSNK